jgi:hypothetical protein
MWMQVLILTLALSGLVSLQGTMWARFCSLDGHAINDASRLRMSCCMGGSKTYPRLLKRAPLARIRLFCDSMLFEGPEQKSLCNLPHHRISKRNPSALPGSQSIQIPQECKLQATHELCQVSRRELSDVFIANAIPTYMSTALAPVCNHVVLM